MSVLLALLRPLDLCNSALGHAGRALTVLAMALMVGVILTQVVFRYGFNAALP